MVGAIAGAIDGYDIGGVLGSLVGLPLGLFFGFIFGALAVFLRTIVFTFFISIICLFIIWAVFFAELEEGDETLNGQSVDGQVIGNLNDGT